MRPEVGEIWEDSQGKLREVVDVHEGWKTEISWRRPPGGKIRQMFLENWEKTVRKKVL